MNLLIIILRIILQGQQTCYLYRTTLLSYFILLLICFYRIWEHACCVLKIKIKLPQNCATAIRQQVVELCSPSVVHVAMQPYCLPTAR